MNRHPATLRGQNTQKPPLDSLLWIWCYNKFATACGLQWHALEHCSCHSGTRCRSEMSCRSRVALACTLRCCFSVWLFASLVNLVWFGFATHCNHSGPTSSARSDGNQGIPVRISCSEYRHVRIIRSFPHWNIQAVWGPGHQFELASFYCINIYIQTHTNCFYFCSPQGSFFFSCLKQPK